jgi:hypothetical protein
MKFVTSPVWKVSKYLGIKENSTPSLYYFILYINKHHKMCIHKEHIAQDRIQTMKPCWCTLPSQHEYKDNGCLIMHYVNVFLSYYVAKNTHRGTSMLSHFDIHPSKRFHNQFHTKFGLKKNSFEHSYFGALKIIDVMLILKRQAQTILKAPVALLHETRQATYL